MVRDTCDYSHREERLAKPDETEPNEDSIRDLAKRVQQKGEGRWRKVKEGERTRRPRGNRGTFTPSSDIKRLNTDISARLKAEGGGFFFDYEWLAALFFSPFSLLFSPRQRRRRMIARRLTKNSNWNEVSGWALPCHDQAARSLPLSSSFSLVFSPSRFHPTKREPRPLCN